MRDAPPPARYEPPGSRWSPLLLRRVYDWTLRHAAGPQAESWYAGVSLIDGAAFPIPPELLQIPMALARPERALRTALIGALASAAGAVIGYFIGLLLFKTVAVPLLTLSGHLAQFQQFLAQVGQDPLFWLVGFCFFPSAAAIAAGSVPLGVAATIAASLVGRGARFFAVALLLKRFGRAAQAMIDRYFHQLAAVAAVLLVGVAVLRYGF
jgi:membrane protein YqaA with SNARE-associated domain